MSGVGRHRWASVQGPARGAAVEPAAARGAPRTDRNARPAGGGGGGGWHLPGAAPPIDGGAKQFGAPLAAATHHPVRWGHRGSNTRPQDPRYNLARFRLNFSPALSQLSYIPRASQAAASRPQRSGGGSPGGPIVSREARDAAGAGARRPTAPCGRRFPRTSRLRAREKHRHELNNHTIPQASGRRASHSSAGDHQSDPCSSWSTKSSCRGAPTAGTVHQHRERTWGENA
jgi:hypothetical protein